MPKAPTDYQLRYPTDFSDIDLCEAGGKCDSGRWLRNSDISRRAGERAVLPYFERFCPNFT
jgi:hypothetical protein